MRILLTVPSLSRTFGGPREKAIGFLEHLPEHGAHAELVGCGHAPGAIGLPVIGKVHATPIPGRIGPLLDAIRRADLVHVIGYRDPVGTLGALYAHRRGTPFILEPAGMYFPRLRSFMLKGAFEAVVGRRLLSTATLIIATSRLEKEEITAEGIDPDRIRVRPNAVSNDLFPLADRGRMRMRMGVPLEAPIVLALGRIAKKKRLDLLAEALGRMPDTWGVVIGPDDRDGGLTDLIQVRERLDLHNRLIIDTRGAWGRERAEALSDADCFCLPSASENFGTAALEAAACGIPVVVSDRCGGSEWLPDNSSVVVPYGDIDRLVAALGTALNGPEVRRAAADHAPELRRELSWSSVAHKQSVIYQDLLAA